MGWNDSEGKDPWSNRGRQSGSPDIDKLLSNFQKKIAGVVGQKKGDERIPDHSHLHICLCMDTKPAEFIAMHIRGIFASHETCSPHT